MVNAQLSTKNVGFTATKKIEMAKLLYAFAITLTTKMIVRAIALLRYAHSRKVRDEI